MIRYLCSFLLSSCLMVSIPLFPQLVQENISREYYIQLYKPHAIQKMRDFGIPASIALAQAILESGNGNSVLARNANNHFGIKCHEWTGATYRWDDDEKNECFRKYLSAEESFYDHSLFLTQRPRYSKLFELEITDYKAWAHGLRSAGYATNPQYAHMLIKVIEENQLFLLDHEAIHGPILVQEPEPVFDDHVFASPEYAEFAPGPNNRTIFLNNRRIFVFARPDDTYFKIANDFDIHMAKLCRLNDQDLGSNLKEGTLVYLEIKRTRSNIDSHQVQANENMHDIAQRYGIRLSNLYRHNKMLEGSEPRAGQMIKLRP
ncbi:MAG: glucosaminidase domain-containing protein [Bacteroidales bacterium]|nr:glucosaminidase domain-containing protein [Bacteroidales bacterium]